MINPNCKHNWNYDIINDQFECVYCLSRVNERPKGCKCTPHKFKLYIGFTDVFEFCETCDEKRPYVEPVIPEPPKPDFKTSWDAVRDRDLTIKSHFNLRPGHLQEMIKDLSLDYASLKKRGLRK